MGEISPEMLAEGEPRGGEKAIDNHKKIHKMIKKVTSYQSQKGGIYDGT